jgi:hypothetical protein
VEGAGTITAAVACYFNRDNPYLRSFREQSGEMVVVTGHDSGSVCLMVASGHEQSQELIFNFGSPVACMQITANVIAIAAASCLYIYGLSVLESKSSPLFVVDLKTQDAELLSYNIRHFDFMKEFALAVTEEGEFLKL